MVKGVSRQVIVVQSPGEELFDQAIFILKDEAVEKGVTDEVLLKQAQQAIRTGKKNGSCGCTARCGPAAVRWLRDFCG